MKNYDMYKVDVPEGKIGNWEIKRFEVPQYSSCRGGRGVPAGTYTGLYRDSYLIMSDTPDEINDHLPFIEKAEGNVLIAGLGIGMVLKALCNSEKVTKVTVIEKSADVVSLVNDHYLKQFGDKFEIIEADIFEFVPEKGVHWNCAWFDIWDHLDPDNLEEMDRLSKKYSDNCECSSFWGKEFIQANISKFELWVS